MTKSLSGKSLFAKAYQEEKFQWLFEFLPIAMWEEDMSVLVKLKRHLEEKSVVNIRNYLSTNSELVKKIFRNIKVLYVNRAALQLYGARSKEELQANFGKTFTKVAFDILIDEFASLLEGKQTFEAEFKSRTLAGRSRDVLLKVSVPERYQGSFARVIVILQDITDRKKLERSLRKRAQLDGLTNLLNHSAITQRLEEEISRAKRYHLNLSCFMTDLDHFKVMNDKVGL